MKSNFYMLLQVLVGGRVPDGLDKGFFYSPTLLGNATTDMRIFQEETFAPVMPLFPCAFLLFLFLNVARSGLKSALGLFLNVAFSASFACMLQGSCRYFGALLRRCLCKRSAVQWSPCGCPSGGAFTGARAYNVSAVT